MLKNKLLSASGAAEAALAIEDVFSTYLYTGNGSTQTITNGIDLAGKGGLVWLKQRSGATNHYLLDSQRGGDKTLYSDLTNAQGDLGGSGFSMTSSGFFLNTGGTQVNGSVLTYASWTFRKAPRFFDVVTWTGNGSGSDQLIAHNLGVTPGCIIVKRTDGTSDWLVWHRGTAATADKLYLNRTDAVLSGYGDGIVSVTDERFFAAGTNAATDYHINVAGEQYVAYLFAHDPLGPSGDGSDGLIACGSYTEGASAQEINLGWEPQWILVKRTNFTSDWLLFDTMRGFDYTDNYRLRPNLSIGESSYGASYFKPTPTGFEAPTGFFSNGSNVVYIAIRRGPMRPPESGSEVFNVEYQAGTDTRYRGYLGKPVDAWLLALPSNVSGKFLRSRLQGQGNYLDTTSTAAEAAQIDQWWDNNLGVGVAGTTYTPSTSTIHYLFRRAPEFFDVVAYTGGSPNNKQIPHNLGVVPELIILKQRNDVSNWHVWCGLAGQNYSGRLNLPNPFDDQTGPYYFGTHTDTYFRVGYVGYETNISGANYIADLFASKAGVSKVGSYTGNGGTQTINCGFTAGARFVLIKRTDTNGDWYVWDTTRGIVAANDPHLSLNTTAAEVTTDDSVDPASSGFIVNQNATTNINVNAASYIYLAIA